MKTPTSSPTRTRASATSLVLLLGAAAACDGEPDDVDELVEQERWAEGDDDDELATVQPPATQACSVPDPGPPVVVAGNYSSMDANAFIDHVVDELGDDYMGYSVMLIGKNGGEMAKAKYGYARSPCDADGEQMFNHNTQVAWGSVTKVLTTALVIDKVERSSQTLDETMWSNLPADWRWEAIVNNSPHMDVRVRDLLGQVSGFAGSTGIPMRERSTSVTLEKPIGWPRTYSNANFAIFAYMGRFFRQGYFDAWDDALSYLDDEEKDVALQQIGVSIYEDAFHSRIEDKIGIEMSCNGSDYTGSNFAKYYTDGSDTTPGYDIDPSAFPGCTTGGIVMSPRDMGTFLHALTRTDDIIDNDTYHAEMATPSFDRLGWDQSLSVTGGRMYTKDGHRAFGGDRHAWAEIVAFPNGTSALIVANSDRTSASFASILRGAYNEAIIDP